ncbi:MAG: undecaprenyl/decaprenyl-phosphate alpha-N-acetylglucosaminyl 1-phosphate transferase [Myxococcales bacterium]|nr:undecaprenyl/decaprenyl-phosphate alpha-N-acetylglucosaminyl 1-phosphate transferase [Myxococcales bacterium]
MRSYVAAFAISAAVAAVLTPLVRKLAMRLDAVSSTGGRHVHARKIPRLGGVAIGIALFAPILALFFVEGAVATLFRGQAMHVVGLMLGGLTLCVVGAVDDTRGVRARYKLCAQIAVAVLAWSCGFRIDAVRLPIFGELSMGVFGLPITVLWIVGITNAVNLIDGLDGLAAGVVFFAGVTNFVVAYTLDQSFSALVMASLLGAVLAFLFYNFNPARIFMGDSGSYLLGYVLATTALIDAAQKASTAVSLLVPIVALGVPIFDTLFAMARRILERRPLFAPDRGHLHHRLLDLGITHRRAVLILYAVSIVLTVASIGIYLGRSWQVGLALLVSAAVLTGLVRFVNYFSYSMFTRRQRTRLRSRDTELIRRSIPQLAERFGLARTEAALFAELLVIAEETELAAFELRPFTEGELPRGEPMLRYTDRRSDARRVVATMTYPIGSDALARAELEISTVNDFEDDLASPQTDILLQIVVDMLAENLVRLESEHAPRLAAPAPSSRRGAKLPAKTDQGPSAGSDHGVAHASSEP